jgi:hypothetical protein
MIGYQRKFTCKQVIIEFAHAPDNTKGLFVYLCIICDAIARETRRDRVLSRVYEQVMNGWKEGNYDELLKPFYNRKSEITLHQGCSMWTLSQVADGHSHGCSGATCGIFCVS